MAGTTTISLTVTHVGGAGGSATLQVSNKTFATAGDRNAKGNHSTNATGGTDNAVPFGTVPTAGAGVGAIVNKSTADNIELSWGTGGAFVGDRFQTLGPGEVWTGKLSGQLYIKATPASVPYEAIIIEA